MGIADGGSRATGLRRCGSQGLQPEGRPVTLIGGLSCGNEELRLFRSLWSRQDLRLDYKLSTNLMWKVLDFVQLGGPDLTVGSTVFEMWMGI